MFRNVPEYSMFLVLSTAIKVVEKFGSFTRNNQGYSVTINLWNLLIRPDVTQKNRFSFFFF